ncbi:hypothetical protein [Leisingera sp. NJS201]|uniref:hypothetical protein n=1 Tax=Leisingera sp. NJS201 TaxID=2508306 RepID=UPI0034A0B4A9
MLPGFVHQDGIAMLAAEADAVAENGHKSFSRTNAYFSKDDPALPETHPVRQFYDRSNAFIPADNFGADSPLRAIYEFSGFMPFIRTALGSQRTGFSAMTIRWPM